MTNHNLGEQTTRRGTGQNSYKESAQPSRIIVWSTQGSEYK